MKNPTSRILTTAVLMAGLLGTACASQAPNSLAYGQAFGSGPVDKKDNVGPSAKMRSDHGQSVRAGAQRTAAEPAARPERPERPERPMKSSAGPHRAWGAGR